MKLRKKELILFGILLAAAAITALVFWWTRSRKEYATITIYACGAEVGTYSLDKDREIPIDTPLGHNVCTIKDHQAYMSEADCPDHRCVEGFPPLTGEGDILGWIICLPHEVIVQINPLENPNQGTDDNAVDNVAS